eukprot:SAG22_NODE_2861_length_2149_cov_3.144878_2_plen_188_part_00
MRCCGGGEAAAHVQSIHDVTDDSGVIGEDSICSGCVFATIKRKGWLHESSVDWQVVRQSCTPEPPQECRPECKTTSWHDLDDVLDDLLPSCDAQPAAVLAAGVLGCLCMLAVLKAVCCKKKVNKLATGSESLMASVPAGNIMSTYTPPVMQAPATDTFCGQCGIKVPAGMTFCRGAPGIAGCGAPVA